MLTRRLLASSQQLPPNLLRSISTTATLQRSPALSDITPNNAATFDARQKKFREQVREAARAKREQDSQLSITGGGAAASNARNPPSSSESSSSSSASPFSLTPSSVASSVPAAASNDSTRQALGSLSTHITGAERESSFKQESTKRGGNVFSNLVYGTHEGRQMDQEIEKSFSQVLARGKYVHSIVFHTVKPDKVDEYVELVGSWYPRMAGIEGNHVHLVGSWRTEVGDCDTFGNIFPSAFFPFLSPTKKKKTRRIRSVRAMTDRVAVHIWEYQRYQGYHASLHSIASHPDFLAFDRHLKTLITSKTTSLMQEFSFWPTTPPRQLGGLFELRSYTLHPGNLLEWETHWRKGLKARKEVMEGVGAWFVQIGELNTVHHLWQFADLEERKARREMSWGVEGWGDTVHKTVPLIQTMKSRILIPMPWSPVA